MTIVALVLLGQVLERRAKRRTGDAIRDLMNLAPATARVVKGDGREDEVPLSAVRAGDVLRVVPGAAVPVDGGGDRRRLARGRIAADRRAGPGPQGAGRCGDRRHGERVRVVPHAGRAGRFGHRPGEDRRPRRRGPPQPRPGAGPRRPGRGVLRPRRRAVRRADGGGLVGVLRPPGPARRGGGGGAVGPHHRLSMRVGAGGADERDGRRRPRGAGRRAGPRRRGPATPGGRGHGRVRQDGDGDGGGAGGDRGERLPARAQFGPGAETPPVPPGRGGRAGQRTPPRRRDRPRRRARRRGGRSAGERVSVHGRRRGRGGRGGPAGAGRVAGLPAGARGRPVRGGPRIDRRGGRHARVRRGIPRAGGGPGAAGLVPHRRRDSSRREARRRRPQGPRPVRPPPHRRRPRHGGPGRRGGRRRPGRTSPPGSPRRASTPPSSPFNDRAGVC